MSLKFKRFFEDKRRTQQERLQLLENEKQQKEKEEKEQREQQKQQENEAKLKKVRDKRMLYFTCSLYQDSKTVQSCLVSLSLLQFDRLFCHFAVVRELTK